MRRNALLLLVALLAALLLSQLLLPLYLGGRVEDRLTKRGGEADVSLRAIPAVRLLAEDGDRLEIEGRELNFDLAGPRPKVFEKVDGFDEVEIDLTDLRAGPFAVRSARLERVQGTARFDLELSASVVPRELVQYVASRFAGSLGELLGRLAGGAIPLGNAPLPVEVHTQVESEDGRARAVGGTGSVAGIPAGPLAEVLASAIVARL